MLCLGEVQEDTTRMVCTDLRLSNIAPLHHCSSLKQVNDFQLLCGDNGLNLEQFCAVASTVKGGKTERQLKSFS